MYQPTAIILLDSIGNATCTSTYNGGSTSLRFGKNKPVSFYIPIIRTIASLPAKYKQQVRLHLGGKGKYKSALERMVTDLGLSDIVSFEGFIDDNKLCDFYSASHIFILCTREEAIVRIIKSCPLNFSNREIEQRCSKPSLYFSQVGRK